MKNAKKKRIVVLLSLAVFFFSFSGFAQAPTPAPAAGAPDGKALFKANCAACHFASSKKNSGPGLMGVLARIPSLEWAHDWVHDNNKLIASGNSYAVQIKKDYNNGVMIPFPALTNEEIDAILNYADPGPDEKKAPVAAVGAETVPVEKKTNPIFLIVIVLVLLIVLIAILRYVKIKLRNTVDEKEGLPPQPRMSFLKAARHWMKHHKSKMALMGVLLFCVLIVKGWYALKGIGVYAEEVRPNEWVGYHPSQPINFSHKIHAGDNGIQCQYCHTGVEKSRTAGIPPAMVCMNCHKVIDQNQAGTPESKMEIAKIYTATGWNADMRAFTRAEKPVVWNKVNVLPDHVFFSHQQHVVVGQVACATCHGDVPSMVTVEQQRPLTMGWCVTCHRETPVKMEGNGYYTAMHEKMKEKYKDQPITVAMAGGIECARCHY